MKLQAFRIKNFRSIKDTNWIDLSTDNITALIGQNESGKTSILDALRSFSTDEIKADDLRSETPVPEVSCSFSFRISEIKKIFESRIFPKGLEQFLREQGRVNITTIWETTTTSKTILEEEQLTAFFPDDTGVDGEFSQQEYQDAEAAFNDAREELAKLSNLLKEQKILLQAAPEDQKPQLSQEVSETQDALESQRSIGEETAKRFSSVKERMLLSEKDFMEGILESLPTFELFEDFRSLLPDRIDLADLQNQNEAVEGYNGAVNFLAILGFDPNDLVGLDIRRARNTIDRLNRGFKAEFQEFWKQKIGKTSQVTVEFELKNHPETEGGKPGHPYLAFWVDDGSGKLYPKQRSKGLLWFLSFYLQLRRMAKENGETESIILIDEPGGSLHARAQEDVLRVFEDIQDRVQIVYTTHSPYLLNVESTYRLLGVQRADQEDDNSETLVFGAHQLGAASSDTLTPLFTLIGVSLSNQNVIKKNDNIILEEISSFYYLKAFFLFFEFEKEVSFIPATGTSNVPLLANLFLGWGLDYRIIVDDDPSGRRIYKDLKKDLFQDDDELSRKNMLKIKDCPGIEDIFSESDFKKNVVEKLDLKIQGKNSEYMKNHDVGKAIVAARFFQKVKGGQLSLQDLDAQTQAQIRKLVNSIDKLLA